MTSEGLALLLAILDPDRERAAERYEEIRKQLIRRFEGLGSTSPEELADLTLDRFAHRLTQGFVPENPGGFLYGIAANVFKEWRRKVISQEVQIDLHAGPNAEEPTDLAEEEETGRRTQCLRRCLGRLPNDQRGLVLAYYHGDDRIGARHQLAGQLGLTPNALRIRAHRVRRQLEDCIKRCLGLRVVPDLLTS